MVFQLLNDVDREGEEVSVTFPLFFNNAFDGELQPLLDELPPLKTSHLTLRDLNHRAQRLVLDLVLLPLDVLGVLADQLQ